MRYEKLIEAAERFAKNEREGCGTTVTIEIDKRPRDNFYTWYITVVLYDQLGYTFQEVAVEEKSFELAVEKIIDCINKEIE